MDASVSAPRTPRSFMACFRHEHQKKKAREARPSHAQKARPASEFPQSRELPQHVLCAAACVKTKQVQTPDKIRLPKDAPSLASVPALLSATRCRQRPEQSHAQRATNLASFPASSETSRSKTRGPSIQAQRATCLARRFLRRLRTSQSAQKKYANQRKVKKGARSQWCRTKYKQTRCKCKRRMHRYRQ